MPCFFSSLFSSFLLSSFCSFPLLCPFSFYHTHLKKNSSEKIQMEIPAQFHRLQDTLPPDPLCKMTIPETCWHVYVSWDLMKVIQVGIVSWDCCFGIPRRPKVVKPRLYEQKMKKKKKKSSHDMNQFPRFFYGY